MNWGVTRIASDEPRGPSADIGEYGPYRAADCGAGIAPFKKEPSVNRTNVSTGAPWEQIIGYSRAVRVGDRVVVTGTVGIDAEGKVVAGGALPATTMVEVARLIDRDMLVEIEAEAIVGSV